MTDERQEITDEALDEALNHSPFWERALECEHKDEDLTDHMVYISCPTPYCSGYEVHCRKCGAFITSCGCHFNDGVSGWPIARWKALQALPF